MTEYQRYEIVILSRHTKLSQRAIAKQVGTSPQTVNQVLQKHRATGSIHDLPKSGRKRKATPAERKQWYKQAVAGQPATQIARGYRTRKKAKLHERTVQRSLREQGLLNLVDEQVEQLTADNKTKRLRYAKDMANQDWKQVLFSDEKVFWLTPGPGKRWQQPGHRVRRPVPKYPKKLNIWGAAGYYMKSKLYFFQSTMDGPLYQKVIKSRLSQNALEFAHDCPRNVKQSWVYLQDNARPHKAAKSMETLRELVGDRLIAHPANSPDLNIVEDLWSHLTRRIHATKIASLKGLKTRLTKEWNDISWKQIRKSVDSMPARLQQCRKEQGGRTRY